MKTSAERAFIRCGRRWGVFLEDGLIELHPRSYAGSVFEYGGGKSLIFDIVDKAKDAAAGEIALRVGENASLYYLGHIGYHIDPPFRGKAEALRACRLCVPFLAELGMRSFVITTDEDNLPSIRTCEHLGCVLERVVDVPDWCVLKYGISRRKRRYVYEMGDRGLAVREQARGFHPLHP